MVNDAGGTILPLRICPYLSALTIGWIPMAKGYPVALFSIGQRMGRYSVKYIPPNQKSASGSHRGMKESVIMP